MVVVVVVVRGVPPDEAGARGGVASLGPGRVQCLEEAAPTRKERGMASPGEGHTAACMPSGSAADAPTWSVPVARSGGAQSDLELLLHKPAVVRLAASLDPAFVQGMTDC
mmetsp:Transcript_28956/g.84525  ORF Transcript_28956/g.84525 Transcript_28956/m.84525 type:complete len:110 (-) Transcript_28956:399-728(-)